MSLGCTRSAGKGIVMNKGGPTARAKTIQIIVTSERRKRVRVRGLLERWAGSRGAAPRVSAAPCAPRRFGALQGSEPSA
eukprot:1910171-Pleurochrysis_carterae.AAC.4